MAANNFWILFTAPQTMLIPLFIIGSYMASLFYEHIIRAPEKKMEKCRKCQAKISNIVKIPIFGMALLKGRCLKCKAPILQKERVFIDFLGGTLFAYIICLLSLTSGKTFIKHHYMVDELWFTFQFFVCLVVFARICSPLHDNKRHEIDEDKSRN